MLKQIHMHEDLLVGAVADGIWYSNGEIYFDGRIKLRVREE